MNYDGFCKLFTSEYPKASQQGERYYLESEDLAGLTSGEARKPYARGLLLGMGAREFVPSAALLTILAHTSDRTATLTNDNAEWLFLCGRNIFAESFKTKIQEGLVLVNNERGENLGLAEITFSERGPILRNILDRGNYLRHEIVSLVPKKERKKNIHARR